MAIIQFHFKELFDSLWWQRNAWAFWKVVNQSMYSGEIYGANEKFHALYPNVKE